MMKAFSFLGNSDYKKTTYVLGSQTYETCFFPAAMANFVVPQQMLVFVTPTVQKHSNLVALGAELEAAGVAWQPISIPEGNSEDDLWQIFGILTDSVAEGDQVTFDITHSFRSLPMLAFLAVAYLKAAKNVQVDRVLYGAYEARSLDNRSPVFDLTPFVSLLDWLSATSRFVETGDGEPLALLLRAGMPNGLQMGQDLAARSLGRELRAAANAIQDISQALDVTRPVETMQSAAHLETTLRQAMPSINQRARPFGVLAEKVIQQYSQFAQQNPLSEGLVDGLQRQLRMLDWYIQRQQVVQAATLARELLVSCVAYRLDAPVFDYEAGRKPIEKALNNAVEISKSRPRRSEKSPYDEAFQRLPLVKQIIALWSQMTEIRNDIAHVGMRMNPKPAAELVKQVANLAGPLKEVASELLRKTA